MEGKKETICGIMSDEKVPSIAISILYIRSLLLMGCCLLWKSVQFSFLKEEKIWKCKFLQV